MSAESRQQSDALQKLNYRFIRANVRIECLTSSSGHVSPRIVFIDAYTNRTNLFLSVSVSQREWIAWLAFTEKTVKNENHLQLTVPTINRVSLSAFCRLMMQLITTLRLATKNMLRWMNQLHSLILIFCFAFPQFHFVSFNVRQRSVLSSIFFV